jgi:hypothetical protein
LLLGLAWFPLRAGSAPAQNSPWNRQASDEISLQGLQRGPGPNAVAARGEEVKKPIRRRDL